MKPLIVYHSDCADGYTAAWVAHKHFQGEVDLHPGVYGQAAPDCLGRDVYILDFSYPVETMEKIMEDCKSLVVLDHHETARDAMAAWAIQEWNTGTTLGMDGDRYLEIHSNKTHMRFDMTKSGALLAWDFFWEKARKEANTEGMERSHYQPPKLIQYVSDRDLWEFKLPHSREINACIFSYAYTMENWDALERGIRMDFETCVHAGAAIERKHFKDINEFIKVATQMAVIGGHSVPLINVPYHWASDAAGILAKGQPFAASYFDKAGLRVFSLRSAPDGLNVAEVAKKFGGGGHAHAAGFSLEGDSDIYNLKNSELTVEDQ